MNHRTLSTALALGFTALTASACLGYTTDDTGTQQSRISCSTDTDCPGGQECEEEHGESFCKPHGGDDGGGASGGDDAGAGGAASFECASDADCPNGEECELEHGGSFCKPHGGS